MIKRMVGVRNIQYMVSSSLKVLGLMIEGYKVNCTIKMVCSNMKEVGMNIIGEKVKAQNTILVGIL